MDQFCITDNESGGSCSCSDASIELEKQLVEIRDLLVEAERVSTEEVERVKMGANADIVFTGKREYDEFGNIKEIEDIGKGTKKEQRAAELAAMFDSLYSDTEFDENLFDDGNEGIADLQGVKLYNAAEELCLPEMPEKCEGDIKLLRNMYSRQILSDCKGLENSIATKKAEADAAMADAKQAVRVALKESTEAANKYDLGQCVVAFKKCMQTEDTCGENWRNCVSIIASENMQNNKAISTANTKIANVKKYDITESTMEILNNKRTICENVLSSCVAVRDMVWPTFLKEAAPTIKVAEQYVESEFRQSCLTNISDCIQRACKDDIANKGVATMDACLSRPEMVRSFCKIEIDPCERMEPLIWGYVSDKLKAMRVDACTQEVKDCFTDEVRCGRNFQNCVGMGYDYIHEICPLDSLVVCKANNPNFSMEDLDSMLMGLYLNIDNSLLDRCQELVDRKMSEICGSTEDCNRFAADEYMGAGSLRMQKDETIYRVTGMISFGSIQMLDALSENPGKLEVDEYLEQVKLINDKVVDKDAIISTISEELNNITGTINRTIEMIEQDPEIQFCVTGRDLSGITGEKGKKSEARFPKLLNQVKMQIAIAALRQAQNNYNKKLNDMIFQATHDASADLAQYMCQRLAATNGELASAPNSAIDTPLTPPYAISYDVGVGLMSSDLLKGGHNRSSGLQTESDFSKSGADFTSLNFGSQRHKFSGAGYEREVWSIFNRDTRVCRFCTSTVTQSCTTKKKNGFLGIGGSNSTSCETSAPKEECQDIPM